MQATHTRLSVSSEWFTTTVSMTLTTALRTTLRPTILCAATCIVGMLAIRELRVAPQAFATPRAAALSVGMRAEAAAVPPEGISIPTLVVGAQELQVGDLAGEAVRLLAATATLAATSDERGPLGLRQIRSYQLDGSDVIVVLEPFERQGPMRVAAIYLH